MKVLGYIIAWLMIVAAVFGVVALLLYLTGEGSRDHGYCEAKGGAIVHFAPDRWWQATEERCIEDWKEIELP